RLSLGLTAFAEKGRPLSLYDSKYFRVLALRASLAFAVVNSVFVLKTSFSVNGVSVSAIGKRRAFILDCQFKDFDHLLINELPSFGGYLITSCLRVNSREVQNFGGIKIANAKYNFLIEHGDFDFSLSAFKPFGEFDGRDSQGIRA
ncbi:MAG: hypothetical protein L7T26_12540, partial [Pseudomonadales bacterium]|nr:hypothetical protein [Pseudomonadales bacterium]